MITREESLKFLNQKIANKNIISHMLATEALMAAIYDLMKSKEETELGGTKQEWMMAGLLHDGDYSDKVPHKEQGIKVTEWLKKEGFEIPTNVAQAMAAHNCSNTKVDPKTKMDWALFICDSLTGLIVATALVRPEKNLASVKVKSVMKKFKQPSFAAGTRREEIALCREKLDILLPEFVELSLKAMQNIASDLGL